MKNCFKINNISNLNVIVTPVIILIIKVPLIKTALKCIRVTFFFTILKYYFTIKSDSSTLYLLQIWFLNLLWCHQISINSILLLLVKNIVHSINTLSCLSIYTFTKYNKRALIILCVQSLLPHAYFKSYLLLQLYDAIILDNISWIWEFHWDSDKLNMDSNNHGISYNSNTLSLNILLKEFFPI